MKKAFTLVEIMIVVVIIGLLAAMAIPAFQKVREAKKNQGRANYSRSETPPAQPVVKEIVIDGKRYQLVEVR